MTHALIVDDEFENQDALQEILQEMGVTTDCAASIDEALMKVSGQPFDVVLMDMALPRKNHDPNLLDMGGLDAAREIQAKLGSKAPPIIAVTCKSSRAIRDSVTAAGIAYIVEKRIPLDERIRAALIEVLALPFSVLQPAVAGSIAVATQNDPVAANQSDSRSPVITVQNVGLSKSDSLSPGTLEQGVGAREQRKPKQPLAPAPRPQRQSTPATIAELRQQVLDHCRQAKRLLEQLIVEALETDRDQVTQKQLDKLKQSLDKTVRRLGDEADGPKPGESYGHWIGNLLVAAPAHAQKLITMEQQQHFEKWSEELQTIKQHIEAAALLGGSDFAHTQKVPPAPVPPAPVPPPGEIAEATTVTIESEFVEITELALDSSILEPLPSIESLSTRRPILIVDDEPDARRDLEDKLKHLNYRVISCDNAATALEFVQELRFEVCLLDLDMPDIDGLELIKRIRQSSTSGKASIIVVSGSPEKFGAAEAIEKGADDYLSKPADERLLKARIESCMRKSQARLEELNKFLPVNVLGDVLSNQNLLDTPMPADISVMVCDIRGFSGISERIGPVQTIAWISDVMDRLTRTILHGGGTIIDYVGDEIMAMWGAPVATQTHANDACKCALAIQQKVLELSQEWFPKINTELKIGIGINSGVAVVGNTGSKHRIKYGPLGNTVNVASRVQGATKYLHSSVLITQSTASEIESKFKGRRICKVRVQNINQPVDLFELAKRADDKHSPRFVLYGEALGCFENEQLTEALTKLAQMLINDPHDGPAKLLMKRVIESQLGGAFDPIWTLPGK